MSHLARDFSFRALIFRICLLALIVVCVAGVSRHSILLEWSSLVATFVLLLGEPLLGRSPGTAQPDAPRVEPSVSKAEKTPTGSSPHTAPGSGALALGSQA